MNFSKYCLLARTGVFLGLSFCLVAGCGKREVAAPPAVEESAGKAAEPAPKVEQAAPEPGKAAPAPEEEAVEPVDTTGMTAPQVFAAVCSGCHGMKGEGSEDELAPSIASLPDWYAESQIKKFYSGMRGSGEGDSFGEDMRGAIQLADPKLVSELAAHIAALPRIPTQNTLGGDPVPGKEAYNVLCEECHFSSGKGDLVFKSPPLIGLQDWYLKEQLDKFRRGLRGGHPDDKKGEKMTRESDRILDDKEENDILAYIAELAKKQD